MLWENVKKMWQALECHRVDDGYSLSLLHDGESKTIQISNECNYAHVVASTDLDVGIKFSCDG